jgi:hypothetical protein
MWLLSLCLCALTIGTSRGLHFPNFFSARSTKTGKLAQAKADLVASFASPDSGAVEAAVGGLLACGSGRAATLKSLGGCCQVLGTTSSPAWTKYADVLGALGKQRNRNFQMFSSAEGSTASFINLSEYWGAHVFATASGTYVAGQPGSGQFVATVTRVTLHLGGMKVRLGVQGDGVVQVLFEDEQLRVIENEVGGRAVQRYVQVPAEYRTMLEEEGVSIL